MKATLFKGLDNKGETREITEGMTLAAAFPDVDFERAACVVNGKFSDGNHVLQADDVVLVRETPGAVTAALIIMGAALAAGAVAAGVMAYKARVEAEKAEAELAKIKSQTGNQSIDNRPFLRGASNSKATGNSQPYIIGRHLFTPYTLNDPTYLLAGVDGETQYTYIVLEGGFGQQVIKSVAIEDVTVKTYSDISPQNYWQTLDKGIFADGEIEIVQGGGIFTELVRLNTKMVSTHLNEEIKKDADCTTEGVYDPSLHTQFTLDPHAKDVTLAISFPQGLFAYNDSGDKITTAVTITPQFSLDGGKTWENFYFNNTGVEQFQQSKWIQQKYGVGRYATTVSKQIVETVEHVAGYTNRFNRCISQKELRYMAHREFSVNDYEALRVHGQSSIVIRVCSNGAKDTKITNACYVLYYQSVCFDPEQSSYPAGVLSDGGAAGLVDCPILNKKEREASTLIGIMVKATAANESKLTKINVITQGIARTWTGAEWTDWKGETRNPAAWMVEILTSGTHPMSCYSDDELDLESFGGFYMWCEENSLYYDAVLTQTAKKGDVLNQIADACGAVLYTDTAGRLSVAWDAPKENALAVYNPQNIISIKNKRELQRRTDCYRIKFVNSENDLFEEDTAQFMRCENGAEVVLDENSVIRDLTLTGVTTYRHAAWYARRLLAAEELRPKTVTVETGPEGVFYTPYAKVLLQDERLSSGRGHSTVKSAEWTDGALSALILNDPVTVEEGKSYGVIVNCYAAEGAVPVPLKVEAQPGRVTRLEVLTALSAQAAVVPESGCVAAFGELEDGDFAHITTPYLISSASRKDSGFSLELVEYNEAMYDEGSIPDRKTNLTRKPAVSNAEIPPGYVTGTELADAVTALGSGEGVNVGPPAAPSGIKAYAERDGIRLSCTVANVGLANDLRGVIWRILDNADGTERTMETAPGESLYQFDRLSDGWPEAVGLSAWNVWAKAVNVYGKESEWSDMGFINTDGYGTWKPTVDEDENAQISVSVTKRTATLSLAQPAGRNVYGQPLYGIWIKKADGAEWLTPDNTLDPAANEDAFTSGGDAPVWATAAYSISLPLKGQGNTAWRISAYDVYTYRESGARETPEGSGETATLKESGGAATPETAEKNYKTLYVSDLSAVSDPLGNYGADEWQALLAAKEAEGGGTWEAVKEYDGTESDLYTSRRSVYSLSLEAMPAPEVTAYSFKICVKNAVTGVTEETTREITFTVSPNTAADLTDAIITNTKLAEGAITADKIAAGTITAETLAAENLLAKGARAGMVETDGLKLDNAGFWASDPLSYVYTDPADGRQKTYVAARGEFFVGNTPETEKDDNAYEYLHYKPGEGFWLRIKNFLIRNLATLIQGVFAVKKAGAADREAFFVVNPTEEADTDTGVEAETAAVNGTLTATKLKIPTAAPENPQDGMIWMA